MTAWRRDSRIRRFRHIGVEDPGFVVVAGAGAPQIYRQTRIYHNNRRTRRARINRRTRIRWRAEVPVLTEFQEGRREHVMGAVVRLTIA
jgi:hypothetical protein